MIPGSETGGISPLRRMIYAGRLIQVISDEDAGIVLDSAYDDDDRWTGGYRPLGRFLVYEEPVFSEEAGDFVPTYTAMDNSTGDCWTESFHSLEVAVRWLAEECDTDEAYDEDAEALRSLRAMDALARSRDRAEVRPDLILQPYIHRMYTVYYNILQHNTTRRV